MKDTKDERIYYLFLAIWGDIANRNCVFIQSNAIGKACGSFALISSASLSTIMYLLYVQLAKLLYLLSQGNAERTENPRVGSSILSLATIL